MRGGKAFFLLVFIWIGVVSLGGGIYGCGGSNNNNINNSSANGPSGTTPVSFAGFQGVLTQFVVTSNTDPSNLIDEALFGFYAIMNALPDGTLSLQIKSASCPKDNSTNPPTCTAQTDPARTVTGTWSEQGGVVTLTIKTIGPGGTTATLVLTIQQTSPQVWTGRQTGGDFAVNIGDTNELGTVTNVSFFQYLTPPTSQNVVGSYTFDCFHSKAFSNADHYNQSTFLCDSGSMVFNADQTFSFNMNTSLFDPANPTLAVEGSFEVVNESYILLDTGSPEGPSVAAYSVIEDRMILYVFGVNIKFPGTANDVPATLVFSLVNQNPPAPPPQEGPPADNSQPTDNSGGGGGSSGTGGIKYKP